MHAVMDGTNAIHIKPLKEGEVYGGEGWWRGSTDCIAGDYGHLLTCMWGADVNIPILLYAQKKPFFSFVHVGVPLFLFFLFLKRLSPTLSLPKNNRGLPFLFLFFKKKKMLLLLVSSSSSSHSNGV